MLLLLKLQYLILSLIFFALSWKIAPPPALPLVGAWEGGGCAPRSKSISEFRDLWLHHDILTFITQKPYFVVVTPTIGLIPVYTRYALMCTPMAFSNHFISVVPGFVAVLNSAVGTNWLVARATWCLEKIKGFQQQCNLVPRVCLFAGYVLHNPRTGIVWERDWQQWTSNKVSQKLYLLYFVMLLYVIILI
jgi:hypothetical protein